MIKYDFAILGGMGTLATIKLLELLYEKDDFKVEQDHVNYLVSNIPSIPDRTKALEDPLTKEKFNLYIDDFFKQLNTLKIKYFATPCNTAHALLSKIKIPKGLTLINMVQLTQKNILNNPNHKVLILATEGTLKLKLYHMPNSLYLNKTLNKRLMSLIYKTKVNGVNKTLTNELIKIIQDGTKDYKEHIYILLGCTELSLYYDDLVNDYNLIDPLRILTKNLLKLKS
ncbi:MAG: amino acid racemase [Acholeplasmataceae bacterium]